MAATIRDIKKRTGLSLATISKYLNGGNVLPENKERIEEAIHELHYEVNEMARGLVTNKTKTIGIIVYSVESLFVGTMLHHIGNVLRRHGYGLLICDSNNDEKTQTDNIRFLMQKKVDGMLIIPVSEFCDILNTVRHRNIPIVLLDRDMPDMKFDSVTINNRKISEEVVSELIQKNHKKISIICSEKEYTGIERYKGFEAALQRAHLTVPEEYCKKGIHSFEHGYDSMKELLNLEDKPTAVVMTNYEITLGALMALKESEFRCPDDISMVGFDNLLLAHLVEPQMYMVVQPMKELGEKSAELLLKRIEDKDVTEAEEIVLEAWIEEGNSVKEL